jgi:cation diffusion facilitator CzcD-associated flavoprotein CzcO
VVKAEHNILVSAVGIFNEPLIPSFKGIDMFKGQIVHPYEWPDDLGTDQLIGKTVTVIGNGCSA